MPRQNKLKEATKTTGALHLSNFPRPLHMDLKASAALRNMTLRDLILDIFKTYIRTQRLGGKLP